jgi:hypothetical protein
VTETHDGWDVYGKTRRMEDGAIVPYGNSLGSSRQQENDGTAIRDEGQRLVGRVEEEHPLHTTERLSAARPGPLTPSEEGRNVVGGGTDSASRPAVVSSAVGGDQTEPPILLAGKREEGWPAPPALPRQTEHRSQRGQPQGGVRSDRAQHNHDLTRQARGSAAPHVARSPIGWPSLPHDLRSRTPITTFIPPGRHRASRPWRHR